MGLMPRPYTLDQQPATVLAACPPLPLFSFLFLSPSTLSLSLSRAILIPQRRRLRSTTLSRPSSPPPPTADTTDTTPTHWRGSRVKVRRR